MKDLASRLTKIITIERPVETMDSEGYLTTNWQQVAKISAEVNAMNDYHYGRHEVFLNMQLISVSPYLFIIRYLPDLTSKMRIIYTGRVFNIRRIVNYKERDVILHIVTEEEMI